MFFFLPQIKSGNNFERGYFSVFYILSKAVIGDSGEIP